MLKASKSKRGFSQGQGVRALTTYRELTGRIGRQPKDAYGRVESLIKLCFAAMLKSLYNIFDTVIDLSYIVSKQPFSDFPCSREGRGLGGA
jgi:hypothetical protein